MLKSQKATMLGFVIGLLPAVSIAALADPYNIAPLEATALRTLFHSAEFNVPDDLDIYAEDLSVNSTSQLANGVSERLPITVILSNETAASELDLVALRTLFHSSEFNAPDNLNDYTEDFSDVAATNRTTVAHLPK